MHLCVEYHNEIRHKFEHNYEKIRFAKISRISFILWLLKTNKHKQMYHLIIYIAGFNGRRLKLQTASKQ